MLEKLLGKWFDEYEIKTRVLPSIIGSLPFIFLGLAVPKEWYVKLALLAGESFIIVAFFKGLVGIIQAEGNRYQDRMESEWNGLPSTRFLRKSDERYSIEFKEQFAKAVKRKLGIELNIENDQSIKTAFSAIKNYLHRNDKQKRWQIHNIDYGFHRNMCGLRIWLLSSHFAALILYILLIWLNVTTISGEMITLWAVICLFMVGLCFASPRACKINAEHYADKTIMTFYEMSL